MDLYDLYVSDYSGVWCWLIAHICFIKQNHFDPLQSKLSWTSISTTSYHTFQSSSNSQATRFIFWKLSCLSRFSLSVAISTHLPPFSFQRLPSTSHFIIHFNSSFQALRFHLVWILNYYESHSSHCFHRWWSFCPSRRAVGLPELGSRFELSNINQTNSFCGVSGMVQACERAQEPWPQKLIRPRAVGWTSVCSFTCLNF